MQLTELSKTDSIIFDLDGTLWDASESCATAWNLASRKVGYGNHVITVDAVKSFSGIKIETVLMEFFSFMPAEYHKAYVFFLKAIPDTDDYEILTGYEIRSELVQPLDGGPFDIFRGKNVVGFINTVRDAIAKN